jgi:hypothetical protein
MGCEDCHSCDNHIIDDEPKYTQDLAYKIKDACESNGCSPEEHAVVLAMAMQEGAAEEADPEKGTEGPQSNWSPFNMNMHQLNKLGCDDSCAMSLGQHSYDYDIDKAVLYVLKGLRGGTGIGSTCDFLNFHRGGSSGWEDCRGEPCSCDCQYDCKTYKDAQADSTRTILADTSLLTSGKRVCQEVGHE